MAPDITSVTQLLQEGKVSLLDNILLIFLNLLLHSLASHLFFFYSFHNHLLMYLCVYMYVCTYVYMYVCICLCIYPSICLSVCLFIYNIISIYLSHVIFNRYGRLLSLISQHTKTFSPQQLQTQHTPNYLHR